MLINWAYQMEYFYLKIIDIIRFLIFLNIIGFLKNVDVEDGEFMVGIDVDVVVPNVLK